VAEFQRKHPVIDPNSAQTKDVIHNHIEEIEQIYENLNTLRKAGNSILSDDPDGSLEIMQDSGMLYLKCGGAWKCVTPTTTGDADPNLNEIQNYHLHYYPTANKLRFYVKDGDAITWTELYPTSVSANVDAIPIADSHDNLDKSWVARFNPIPLSQHNTEASKITLCKGDRAYLNLNGNKNDIYISVNTGEPQLFDMYIEWYDSDEGTGCYLVPATLDYATIAGFYATQGETRGYSHGTTDRIVFGYRAQGIAIANISFDPRFMDTLTATARTDTTKVYNYFLAQHRYRNFVYFGSIQGGSNMKGRALIERVW